MTVKAWFPTLIYCSDLLQTGIDRFNRELLKESYQIRDHDRRGRVWSEKNYPGGYTSYASLSHLHKMSSTFGKLERSVTRHVRLFAKALEMNLKGRKVEMTDCWINIMPEQVVHSLHLHPLSFISGTYYLQTPPESSRLRFEDPRLSKFMAAPPKLPDCRPENRQHVSYLAEVGKLVLFESWLRHEVASNQSNEDRISISFNYNWW